jgi:hypothetical protein
VELNQLVDFLPLVEGNDLVKANDLVEANALMDVNDLGNAKRRYTGGLVPCTLHSQMQLCIQAVFHSYTVKARHSRVILS